ncbi:hypothetical protein SCUP515_04899 [Seiridium cupressi]
MIHRTLVLALLAAKHVPAKRHRAQPHYGYYAVDPIYSNGLSEVLSSASAEPTSPTAISSETTSINSVTSSSEVSVTSISSATIPPETTSAASTIATTSTSIFITTATLVATTSALSTLLPRQVFVIRDEAQRYELKINQSYIPDNAYFDSHISGPGIIPPLQLSVDEEEHLVYSTPGDPSYGYHAFWGPYWFKFLDPAVVHRSPLANECNACSIEPDTLKFSCQCGPVKEYLSFVFDDTTPGFLYWYAYPVDTSNLPTTTSATTTSTTSTVSVGLAQPTFIIRDANQQNELVLQYDMFKQLHLVEGRPYLASRASQPLDAATSRFTLNKRGDLIYVTPGDWLDGYLAYSTGDAITIEDSDDAALTAFDNECIFFIDPVTSEIDWRCGCLPDKDLDDLNPNRCDPVPKLCNTTVADPHGSCSTWYAIPV